MDVPLFPSPFSTQHPVRKLIFYQRPASYTDHALMLGNPAKKAGWMCKCGERLTDDLQCLACEKAYAKEEEGLRENKET